MKKKKIVYFIVIGIIFLILLALIFVFVNDKRSLTKPEAIVKDASSFIIKIVNIPVSYIKDQIIIEKEKEDIHKKYQSLKKRVEKLEVENKKYKESLLELNNIKSNLDLNNSLAEYEIINSSIIYRNVGYWYDTITIDKGSNNKVDNNLAVMTTKGLVGKVIKVSNTTSTVKLLTSITEETKISVKITDGEDNIYGLLTGYNSKNKTFIVEGISENREIKNDLLVTTTGLDNIFPSGIVVGKVSGVSKDNFDLALSVSVKSEVDFDDLRYVMIVKRSDIK